MPGAIAGILTALGFSALHQLLISDIWFSAVPMMVAGAACGGSLAWTYDLLIRPASAATWILFVSLQLGFLILLGVASLVLLDPIVPMAVVMAANEPPNELIAQAMPLTAGFTVLAAGATSLIWGRGLREFGSALVTSAVLIVLLGLNVSALGLVEMSSDSMGVIAEFFALLAVIMLGYGIGFYGLARRSLFTPEGSRR